MIEEKLSDLGEQGILNSVVFPAITRSLGGSAGLGDDCAVIELPPTTSDKVLVATTDPCPRPVVFDLFEPDYWHYGWMTVLINLSDLAAMGAEPAGMLISTVMKNDMPVHDYSRFWEGIIEASNAWGCKILGGNIKDGLSFSADGTALGWATERHLMRRVGCCAGDLLYAVGDMGIFWSAVLHRSKAPNLPLTKEERAMAVRALRYPIPRITEGRNLADSGLVTACMDASDGVLGCLLELGRSNHLDVHLSGDLESQSATLVRKVASELELPLLKLMLSWGDWQLVLAIRRESQEEFNTLIESMDTTVTFLGSAERGHGRVYLETQRGLRKLQNLSSERFSDRSYFTRGIAAYVDWFIETPLLVEERPRSTNYE